LEPLLRVPSSGGTPVPATVIGPGEEGHRWPSFLPDGRRFVFLGDSLNAADHNLRLGSLDTTDSRVLFQAITNPVFAAPNYILYMRTGNLLAQPFDLDRGVSAGASIAIAKDVVNFANNHRFEFSASTNGVLAYRSAPALSQLEWVDRNGRLLSNIGKPEHFSSALQVSPDGRLVACTMLDTSGRSTDVWMIDAERGGATHFTRDGALNSSPAWSPDGQRVAYSSCKSGAGDIYVAPTSAPSETKLLLASTREKYPRSWSPDGHWIVFDAYGEKTKEDIWMVSVDAPNEAKPLVASPDAEWAGTVSPDGRWLAYLSDESGRTEAYVQSFPVPTTRRQVSTDGAVIVLWSKHGEELLFWSPQGSVMSCAIGAGAEFIASPPELLFKNIDKVLRGASADGQRLLIEHPLPPTDLPLDVVLDWTELLKRS